MGKSFYPLCYLYVFFATIIPMLSCSYIYVHLIAPVWIALPLDNVYISKSCISLLVPPYFYQRIGLPFQTVVTFF